MMSRGMSAPLKPTRKPIPSSDGARADQRSGQGKRGEIIEIKTLVSIRWNRASGSASTARSFRATSSRSFVCTYNGEEVFRADLSPAIAANPFIAFSTIATESGTIAFSWSGDNGFSAAELAAITVE